MGELQSFLLNDDFILESGEILPDFHIAYQTFGQLNANQDNVIWIVHALTANSDPTEWWSDVVGANGSINPEKHFIICANAIGSPYGSISPLSTEPQVGEPYYHRFPMVTVKDQSRALDLLRIHLGIHKIKLIVGASFGGQQVLEWAINRPEVFDSLLLIATNAVHSPWGIAFNESQRMAIEADDTWKNSEAEAGAKGLEVARSIALLSYRTSRGYNLTQMDSERGMDDFRASSYQRYQGEKLRKRFNALSYYSLSKGMDSHDVGRGRISRKAALKKIQAKVYLIGIDSDILFPVSEQQFIADHVRQGELFVISSELGHDGFLVEYRQVNQIISDILIKSQSSIQIFS